MTDGTDDLVVRRTVQASREIAFEVWTTPKHVEKWWAPTDTARCTVCEIDLRVGGQYRLHMTDPADGTTCEVVGEFREITRPERLVYTWNARTQQGDVENTLVTVDFRALGEAVELVELDRAETQVRVHSETPSRLLVLTGEPIDEPVVGQGPFVMSTREEIEQAIEDYQQGRMGRLA